MKFQKLFAATLLSVSLVSSIFLCSGALAHQYDIEGAKKANKVRDKDIPIVLLTDVVNAIESNNRTFENDSVEINLRILTSMYWEMGHLKDLPQSAIYGNKGHALGRSNLAAKAAGVVVEIKNKTDKVMEVDLDRSMISVAGYQGRGVRGDVRKLDSATVQQAPLVVFPKSKQQAELYIPTEFIILNTGVELLGNFIFCVNNEYVTMTASSVINADKLHWAVVPKDKK